MDEISKKYKWIIGVTIAFVIIVIICWIFFHKKQETGESEPIAFVRVEKPVEEILPDYLTVYGIVNFTPEQIQQISLQNEVVVKKIFVTQGQQVVKGDPLLELAPSYSAHLNIENAKIAVKYAKQQLARAIKLRLQYLATNADVQAAKQNLMTQEAALKTLLKQEDGENGKQLLASQDGMVVTVTVQTGQLVSAGVPLLSFAASANRQVRLGIESEDLSSVHVGQSVEIISVLNKKVKTKGVIETLSNQVDPTTGLVDAIVPVGPVAGLISGSMVRGLILLNAAMPILTVSHSAVLYSQGKAYVFLDMRGRAVKRWVTVGVDNGYRIAILSGLNKFDQVVYLGNYELENGMLLRVGAVR